jgi:hypothetical protein
MRLDMLRAMVWGMLGVGLVVVPVSAANGPTKVNSGNASTATAGNANTLTALHQVKTLLDTAIHDYDGHRAKAVGEIHHAIHELTPHTQGHKATGAAKGKAAGGAKETTTPGETQAQSDAQLKQALQLLSGLSGQVSNAKAATHIQTAITELNTALKIK